MCLDNDMSTHTTTDHQALEMDYWVANQEELEHAIVLENGDGTWDVLLPLGRTWTCFGATEDEPIWVRHWGEDNSITRMGSLHANGSPVKVTGAKGFVYQMGANVEAVCMDLEV